MKGDMINKVRKCLHCNGPSKTTPNNILLMKGSCMHAVFLRVRTVTFPQVHSYTYIPKGESCV